MKHDETLARLRTIRETVTRIVQDVDDAIAHIEGFQPVIEAYQRRQAAVQAQWDDLMQAGGPDNLDAEAQMRHATALRIAEINVMNALRDYLADPQPAPVSDSGQPESHAEEPPAPNNPAQEHQPY